MTFLEQMDFAMDIYFKGRAPVLINKNGVVLHGQESLDVQIDSKECLVIRDVDISPEHWKVSPWPLTLESARQVWLKNRKT
jgi:hypothetical protein